MSIKIFKKNIRAIIYIGLQNLPADAKKDLNVVIRYYKEGGDFKVFLRYSKGERQNRKSHRLVCEQLGESKLSKASASSLRVSLEGKHRSATQVRTSAKVQQV